MKIAFFNTNNIWGGGEQWHFNMLKGLKEKQYNVLGVTSHSPLGKKLKEINIPVFHFNASGFTYLNPFKLYKLYRFYKRENIKAVIFGLPHDLKVGGIAARLAGVEKIIYARALAAPVKNGILNKLLFKKVVTHVVANSQETMKMMLAKNPTLIPTSKRHVIYYGLNVKEHEAKSYQLFSFREEGKLIIGNAGRLTEQKGQLYLLDLAETLIRMGRTDFKIEVAGSGELEEKIKSEIQRRKLENHIEILGFVENVKSFMESVDVFVLTSLWEGFGFVIAEAFLSKKPVVAWDTTSNPELVKDDENGFLVPTGDVQQMGEKIHRLLDDEAKRKILGQSGYDDIANNFTHEKELSKWGELLDL